MRAKPALGECRPRAASASTGPNTTAPTRGATPYASKPHVPDYAIRVSDGAVYRVVSDQLGSVVLVVNVNDASDVLLAARYGAFGEQEVLAGSADAVPFGFAGGLYDTATGLTRFGARDYDPKTGRWTAKDPILWDGGQANLYAYASSDPVNRTDPLGKSALGCAACSFWFLSCDGNPWCFAAAAACWADQCAPPPYPGPPGPPPSPACGTEGRSGTDSGTRGGGGTSSY